MVHQPHRMRRSRDDRFIAGVAGGLAEYFDVDPVLVRMGWILLTMATVGLAVLNFLLPSIIGFTRRLRASKAMSVNDAAGASSRSDAQPDLEDSPSKRHVVRNVIGIGLLVVGMIILLQQLDVLGSIPWNIVWPVVIVLLGISILLPSTIASRR